MLATLKSLCVSALCHTKRDSAVIRRLCSSETTTALKTVVVSELVKSDSLHKCEDWLGDMLAGDENFTDLDLSNTSSLTDSVIRRIASSRGGNVAVRSLKLAQSPNHLGQRSVKLLAAGFQPLTTLDVSHSLTVGLVKRFSLACEGLQTVKADYTELTDSEVSLLLQRCAALQQLSVRGCSQLTDKAFTRGLKERSFLISLDLRDCKKIGDPTLLRIANSCPTLLELSLENQVFDTGITAVLNNCLGLKSLAIPLCKISESSLFLIRNTSCRVKALDLFGARFKEETLLFLFGNVFRNLQKLNVAGVQKLTLDVIKFICKRSPRLQCLSLKGHLFQVTDEYIDVVAANLHELQSIDLGLCRSVTNAAILRLIEACPATLREVGFVGCPNVQDDVLKLLARQCGHYLEKVSLGGCKVREGGWFSLSNFFSSLAHQDITDEAIMALASRCTNLRTLCVKGTSCASPEPLMELVSANPRLQVLSLSGVKGCCDKVLRAVCAHCPELRELYVSGVWIGKEVIDQFRRVQPKCEVHGKRRRVAVEI